MAEGETRVHFVDHDGTEIPAAFDSWDADDYAWLVVDGPNTQHYTIARYSAVREVGTWHYAGTLTPANNRKE